jgi:hypothetical protein
MKRKSQANLRMSDLTRGQLEQLQEWWGTSLTETISLCVDRAYQRERASMKIGDYKTNPGDTVTGSSYNAIVVNQHGIWLAEWDDATDQAMPIADEDGDYIPATPEAIEGARFVR